MSGKNRRKKRVHSPGASPTLLSVPRWSLVVLCAVALAGCGGSTSREAREQQSSEVAARAVVWAARHRRREPYVGLSTAITILGDKAAPSFGDLYLAKTGFESQQTAEPVDPDRPDNLFEPVPGDQGARGRFDERSHERDPYSWLSRNRDPLLTGAGALLALLGALRR